MGSGIELNDTLQITTAQGFPHELNLSIHEKTPFKAEDFTGRHFEFQDKSGLRVYQAPPVRNFLAHNIEGKWLYWGLVEIVALELNYKDRITAGTFKITYIYSPDEMRSAHHFIDRRSSTQFFN